MRFVATKTPEQQSGLMLHRTRHLFIRQQTSVINAIRAHLAEFGIVAPVGRKGIEQLLEVVADPSDKRLPDEARACLDTLGSQLLELKADPRVRSNDSGLAPSNPDERAPQLHTRRRPLLATALVASVADPKAFRSGRNFSAWIGLVPKQHSSGGGTGSAVSAKRGTAICAACSWPAHSPSSAMPSSTAPSIGHGSQLAGTTADQSRRHRAGQQARANGLGDDG